jgi:hypothetical protein
VAGAAPEDRAVEQHLTLIEVLKHLNQAEMEEPEGEGLEVGELFGRLRRGPCPFLTEETLAPLLDTLVANGMAKCAQDARYAWDRGREMRPHYTITLPGKEFLVAQDKRVGRIG